MDGDVIFQVSDSAQSKAIQLATQSKYSHCGIIFHKDGKPYVYEAVSNMVLTPLDTWIRRGIKGHYLLMRLKDRAKYLDATALAGMEKAAHDLAGKRYVLLLRHAHRQAGRKSRT